MGLLVLTRKHSRRKASFYTLFIEFKSVPQAVLELPF